MSFKMYELKMFPKSTATPYPYPPTPHPHSIVSYTPWMSESLYSAEGSYRCTHYAIYIQNYVLISLRIKQN